MLDAVDLETTGLPREELFKTKITELSMVAVKRSHILDTVPGSLPRVLNKFTICFNPGRVIEPGATLASGLDNDLLEYETPFNMQVFNSIINFLECQRKPVCLIAENGYSFDFPILKNHFEKLKVSLHDDIMCADSLHAFYDILKAPVNIATQQTSVNSDSTAQITPVSTSEEVITIVDSDDEKETSSSNCNGDLSPKENGDFVTPTKMQQQNETTPRQFKLTPVKRISQIKRRLFYGVDKKPAKSYKLKDIYERALGRSAMEAHRAENDCIMTAEIATANAEQFVKWVDENHCAFKEVLPMKL